MTEICLAPIKGKPCCSLSLFRQRSDALPSRRAGVAYLGGIAQHPAAAVWRHLFLALLDDFHVEAVAALEFLKIRGPGNPPPPTVRSHAVANHTDGTVEHFALLNRLGRHPTRDWKMRPWQPPVRPGSSSDLRPQRLQKPAQTPKVEICSVSVSSNSSSQMQRKHAASTCFRQVVTKMPLSARQGYLLKVNMILPCSRGWSSGAEPNVGMPPPAMVTYCLPSIM